MEHRRSPVVVSLVVTVALSAALLLVMSLAAALSFALHGRALGWRWPLGVLASRRRHTFGALLLGLLAASLWVALIMLLMLDSDDRMSGWLHDAYGFVIIIGTATAILGAWGSPLERAVYREIQQALDELERDGAATDHELEPPPPGENPRA